MTTISRRFTVSLSRSLSLFDITMIGVGAMIGAGIFGLTGIAAGVAGPVGLLLAFALNGVVTSLTGLTYAELGAAYPQAGGSYSWVKIGLPHLYGFYAGWLSWFSSSVACSLYAVLFGTFLSELIKMGGVSWGQEPILQGLTGEMLAVKGLAVLAALAFIFLNTRGASETGMVGNVVTIFKVLVLMTMVGFGLRAMANMPNWTHNFLSDPSPLPNGIKGVVLAMGLTFIAFEGYEIIAQSGEEVENPERNVPRAIFLAIAIVVIIYLLVAFVSIGALVQNSGDPNWMFLGHYRERAMIWTAKAIMPYGALIMILGGLASTMSAMNATIYSSSRVSFAMGRERDLPAIFGRIHRHNKTPHWAIWLSGILIIFMAVLLPIEDVAAGASITFLLLFLTVNLTLIRLRKTKPDLSRPFHAPLVPWLQYLAIIVQVGLAVTLVQLSLIAWEATIVWLLLGVLVYRKYGGAEEAIKTADTILLEETIATREYSVMVPVANESHVHQLARLGALLAKANDGELFALHVVRVPQQVGLSDGRTFLRQGRPLLEEVISVGQHYDVPVHTMLRLGRNIAESIISAARERNADLILLGWPDHMSSRNHAFGNIVDLIGKTPPCDLAVVRFHHDRLPRRILIPTAGGTSAHLALRLAVSEADAIEQSEGTFPEIVILNLMPAGTDAKALEERRLTLMKELDLAHLPIKLKIKPVGDVVQGIVNESAHFDQVIVGASEEGLLEQSLFGSIPQKVAKEAPTTVIMVKQYNPVKFSLRRWL